MSANMFSKEAKETLRERAYEQLEKYGPGVVCIFMNTADKEEWENKFGENLDPGVEGVLLVDDPRHPQNRVNLVYQADFDNWKQGIRGRQEGEYIPTMPKGARRRRPSSQSEANEIISD